MAPEGPRRPSPERAKGREPSPRPRPSRPLRSRQRTRSRGGWRKSEGAGPRTGPLPLFHTLPNRQRSPAVSFHHTFHHTTPHHTTLDIPLSPHTASGIPRSAGSTPWLRPGVAGRPPPRIGRGRHAPPLAGIHLLPEASPGGRTRPIIALATRYSPLGYFHPSPRDPEPVVGAGVFPRPQVAPRSSCRSGLSAHGVCASSPDPHRRVGTPPREQAGFGLLIRSPSPVRTGFRWALPVSGYGFPTPPPDQSVQVMGWRPPWRPGPGLPAFDRVGTPPLGGWRLTPFTAPCGLT